MPAPCLAGRGLHVNICAVKILMRDSNRAMLCQGLANGTAATMHSLIFKNPFLASSKPFRDYKTFENRYSTDNAILDRIFCGLGIS